MLGITCLALSISSASILIQELCSTFEVLNKGKFEDSHGAICATGYVVAQCMTRIPSEAFSHLLAEQNELTQEMASRGMSIVYELGDSNTKSELVQALVSTLTGTAKRKQVVKLTEDSEVFEEGSIGERPGGEKLSTYKELCSLATDMGQPDLIYKFMDLSNYRASLNSKHGDAFGFSKIAK